MINFVINKLKLNRFQDALVSPLSTRCNDLTQIFHEASLKDLQGLFSSLVLSIFGVNHSVDWGICRLTKQHDSREFETLRYFLGPDGPLLRLSYKLLGDGCPQYEFPVSCLPAPSKQALEEGTIPLLYSNKLQFQIPGALPTSLHLNAFEFYFFHFAYHLIYQSQMKNAQWQNIPPADILYAQLLEDYLNYFLPVDGSSVPPLPASPTSQSPGHQQVLSCTINSPDSLFQTSASGISQSQFSHFVSFGSPMRPNPHQSFWRQRPSLLKPGTPLSVTSSPGSSSSGNVDALQVEIWRSEAFVLILIEMYLNQSALDAPRHRTGPLLEVFLPTYCHVWMVRMLVKHLHFFSNSAKSASLSASSANIAVNPLEQLKNILIPQFFKKKFYAFMKLTFDHWPLDMSFRLPLETWLSYLQPWRYPVDLSSNSHLLEDRNHRVDPSWHTFVSENILFYSVIFQQVLKRFLRMDLSCPKNAYMLFRVAKVFGHENLSRMIIESECGLRDMNQRSPSASYSPMISQLYCSIRTTSETSISPSVRQQLSDLESSNFEFVPMFNSPVISEVSSLLSNIVSAREKAAHQLIEQENCNNGWLSRIQKYFESDNCYTSEEFGSLDTRKVDFHLEASTEYLCSIFGLAPPTFKPPSLTASYYPQSSASLPSTPRKRVTNVDGNLTPRDRYEIMQGLRKAKIKYQGHPDLQPIRSFEIACLVRILWVVSTFLNTKFSRQIQDYYDRPTLLGRMCHQLLASPVSYHQNLKDSCAMFSPRQEVVLPPRVNLRMLAHKQMVGYFAFLMCSTMYCGYHPMTVIFLIAGAVFFIVFLKALYHQYVCKPGIRVD